MKRLFLFLLYLKVLNIVDVIIIKINSINGIFLCLGKEELGLIKAGQVRKIVLVIRPYFR